MQNLKLLFRQLIRNGLFATLNITGLFIGFTVFTIIIGVVKKERSYDDFWENNDRIYRVALEQYQNGELQFRMAPNYRGVGDLLVLEMPEMENRVRLHKDRVTVFAMDEQIQDVDMYYADTCIFSVLKREIFFRESSDLFTDIHSVVISNSLARSLYGNENPIGKLLKLNEGWRFYVSAVFEDIPENSHMHFDMLLTMASLRYYMRNFNNVTGQLEDDPSFQYTDPGPYDQRAWGMSYGYTYILVKEGADIKDLEEKAASLISKVELPNRLSNARINLLFQPVTEIHLKSDLEQEMEANGSINKVNMLILIACIVLIISWINFINLSALIYYEQTPDLGIRIIHGAQFKDIMKLFYLNGLGISFIAGILTLITIFLFATYAISPISPGWFEVLIPLLLVLLGAFPVLIIPTTHLKSTKVADLLHKDLISHLRGKLSRQVLVVIQFTTSIILISGTILIFSQIRFIQNRDLGFSPNNIIYSYSPMTMNQRPDIKEKLLVFRNEIKKFPAISGMCTSSSVPGHDFLMHSEDVRLVGRDTKGENYFNILNVDQGYLETYNLKLLAGNNFADDDNFNSSDVIINRIASERLGFKEPGLAPGEFVLIDRNQYQIVGVVENFHHLSLKQDLTPVLIFKSIRWRFAVGYYSFKINSENNQQTIKQIGNVWSEIYPGEKFIYKHLEDTYAEQYRAEKSFSRTFALASILAVFISCLGLIGFSRYSAMKRAREIGIRKIAGADKEDILKLLNTEIIKLVLISAIIGIPVCLYLMNRWLMNFAYKIKPEWWMFAAGGILVLIIALLSVIVISLRAAGQNPVEVIKYE